MTQSIPSNPIDPSIPSSSFVPAAGSPPITEPITDHISAYSANIAAGSSLSIIGYSSSQLSSTNTLNETTWQVQQFNANNRDQMYLASLQQILSLLNLYADIAKTTSLYSDVYKNNSSGIGQINNKIDTYNNGVGGDNHQVNILNDAINDYNAGNITQAQLQSAINTYNNYANNRNDDADDVNDALGDYNSNLGSKNAELQTLINQLIADGVPPSAISELNLQGGTTQTAGTLQIAPNATSPPMTLLSPPGTTTLIPLTNDMNNKAATDGTQLTSELFATSFAFMQGQLALTMKMLQNQSDYQGFIQFYLNNVPYVPASFYQPAPLPLASSGASGGSGAGSGGALTTIVTSLSNSLMESILSQTKFTAAYGKAIQAPTPQVVNQLLYLGLGLLSRIGLQSGSPSLRLLEGRQPFIDIESSPVLAGLIGTSLGGEAADFVKNGTVLVGVKAILSQAYPGLDANSLNALAEKLSAAVDLFILQASVAQLGQALDIPDLLDQIFTTLPNVPKTVSSKPTSTSADIVKDDIQREQVSRDAANATAISQDIINHAINQAIVNGDYNQKAFVTDLVSGGIDEKKAINAEVITRAYLNSEIVGKGVLDQSVASNTLNHSVLSNQLVSSIVAGNPAITNRELRDRLVDEFVKNGATQEEAIGTATLAVTGKTSPPPAPEALPDILYKKGYELVEGIGYNPSESNAFATQVVNNVGDLRDLIASRLDTIIKGDDAKTTQKAYDSFQAFQPSSPEGFAFEKEMRSNAGTYVTLMTHPPEPTNYKRDVDIAV